MTGTSAHPAPWYSPARLGRWIESRAVQRVVIAVILINAVALGIQTAPDLSGTAQAWLTGLDRACLAVFVAELAIKVYAFRRAFFRSAWNVFDLVVVALALVPGSAFAVLRALRVLRVLRLVSAVPALRRVVEALVRAVPGIVAIGGLLVLLFYVGAVLATTLFGNTFPEYFGTLGASLVSLFQTMTMDNWSTIGREMAPVHPWVWAFFVPFILLSAFTVLNLFVAVMVDAMKFMAAGDDDAAQRHGVSGAAQQKNNGAAPHDTGAAPDDSRGAGPDAPEPAGASTPVDGRQVLAEIRALRAELERHGRVDVR